MERTIAEVIDEYLHRCFATEETPRVGELAEILGVTRERLSREFAAEQGTALSDYLKDRQIGYAQQLLLESAMSTTQIAYRCGFGTRRTFYRSFRRRIGLSPDEFRKRIGDR